MEVNLELNLYNNIIKRETGFKYNLIGVVSKYRKLGTSEYFFACCKSPIDNQWYNYNNDIVSEINNIKIDIFETGEPNILFYQKDN